MKKILAVLIFSAVCVAILFAQEAADKSQTPETVRAAPAVMTVPVTPDKAAPTEEAPFAMEVELPAVEPVLPVVAQQVEEEVVEKEIETDVVGITDDLSAGAEISGGLISLSLKNVEMQDVVRLFSRLSNANIIVPDMTDTENPKRIDVNLDNVEWKPALQAILDTHGLELIEKIPGSEVYSIRERPADAPEPVAIQVFKLNYATVGEVLEMVDELVEKDGGQISSYPARNTIVVQGTAQLLNDLDQIVTAIDLPREQVFIEAKFLELSDSASEQLGIDWNVLGGYKVGMGGISGNYDFNKTQTDTISKFSDVGGNTYEKLESAPADPILSADGELFPYFINGIDYNASDNNLSSLTRIFGITPTDKSTDLSVVGKTLAATLNADDFNLVMSALKEMNGAKIVSNPKIIVANEETASIQIGQLKPNIKGIIQTAGDSQVNRVYALDDVEPYFTDGVSVEVTPTVNTEDNITVRITPTLDRLDADPTVAPDGTDFWGKSTKTINTVFALNSGQTAAIGGLTEVSKSNVDRKIPLLGDLPYLGRLFSYKSKSSQQVETIIFVTVGLANPETMEFEVGLPEDSRLAMRHRVEAEVSRSIHQEELSIFKEVEAERLQNRLESLRTAEQERLEAVRVADQKQLDKKLADEKKLLEKQQKLLEKERAEEQQKLEKQRAEEQQKLEKQQQQLEKQRVEEQQKFEKQQQQLEKERAEEQEQLEKQQKQLEKQRVEEQEQLEKQRVAEQKRLEQQLAAEEKQQQLAEEVSLQLIEEESPQLIEEENPQLIEEESPQLIEEVSQQLVQQLVQQLFEEESPQLVEEVTPQLVEEEKPQLTDEEKPLEETVE